MSSHVLYVHIGKLIIKSSQEKLEMSRSHFKTNTWWYLWSNTPPCGSFHGFDLCIN